MNETTQTQQAAAAPAPQVDRAVAAPSLEQEHSQVPHVFFSDDAPLFVDGPNDVHDDFFSSPEWTELTDPSPALTTSMSFTLESCDTSPLLTDNYEAPDLSGMPLFGDYNSHALYASDDSCSPKRSPQNAFSRAKEVTDDGSAMLLLRALSNHSSVALKPKDDTAQQPPTLTASPSVISSPLPSSTSVSRPPLFASLSSSSSLSVQDKRTERQQSSFRGVKRRMDASELLPLDAPIQPRTYKTPSATSRKESSPESSFAAEEAAIAAEKDPLVAKRLSNTLAARRSRIRKAEERQQMLDQIEEEANEKEMWKRRCIRAEEELDRARAQGFL